MSAGGRLSKIKQKFEASVRNGNYYEASQMIKTLYHRYKSQQKFADAELLVYDAASLLLRQSQHESGMDLCRLLVSSYKESRKGQSIEDCIDPLVQLIEATSVDSASRQDFILEAISLTTHIYTSGHPRLRKAVALRYWHEKNYECARQHFLHSPDELCARFLVEFHVVKGVAGERDLFIAQAVLHLLCLRQTTWAPWLFFEYTQQHPGIRRKTQPFKQPLLNFVAFLFLAIDKGQSAIREFSRLVELYKPSLDRDPNLLLYVDKIGQLYFGVPPKKSGGLEAIFGDFMQTFLGNDSPSEGTDSASAVEEALD